MKFYEKLIILRKKALLSQEELAEKLDVTRQTISKWELGQSKPDIDKLQMMSKLFEVDINTLTDEEVFLEEVKEEKTEKVDKKINNIMMLAESYPDLKANSQFLSLQDDLNNIEEKLNYARTSYNNAVTSYNNLVESVPSNIIAKIFSFKRKELFKIDEEKRNNIKVNFNE